MPLKFLFIILILDHFNCLFSSFKSIIQQQDSRERERERETGEGVCVQNREMETGLRDIRTELRQSWRNKI